MSFPIDEKICIHKYLTSVKTNPQPPGFADYLRGTIALFHLSKIYGYTLLLDNTHPIFKFFKRNDNFTSNKLSSDVFEALNITTYDNVYVQLNNIFKNNQQFTVMTNSFYTFNNGKLCNWGDITEDCRMYLKDILSPTTELENNIEYVIRSVYNIKPGEQFKVIHIRTGDHFIHNDTFNLSFYQRYHKKISDMVCSDKNTKYVLISDASILANKLAQNIEGLCYWDNKKVHLGDLYNTSDAALFDTLTDFFILSQATEIIYDNTISGFAISGFSIVVSLIYNIKYRTM